MDTSSKYFLPAAVVLAGLFIAGAVIWNSSHPASMGGAGTPSAVNIKNVKIAGEPFIGDENAPVTIAEWSDYQCPFCKQWELSTLPQIMRDYVDTGKVKIVFKDFAFLGPASTVIAEYARAIWALYPDQYFAWRTAVFIDQQQENSLSAADTLAWLKKTTASVASIDVNKVAAAVAANKAAYDAALEANKTEALSFQINATPSFIVGTQLIQGALPYTNFQSAIDATLGS